MVRMGWGWRSARATVRAAAAAALLPLLGACDPCAGYLGCESTRFSFRGRMVDHATGAPVQGVRLEFVRTGGAALATDTVSAETGADGRYHLLEKALEPGTVRGHVTVAPPEPNAGYVVRGLDWATVGVRGDSRFVEPWVVNPYTVVIGFLRRRSDGRPVQRMAVEFRRTEGVPVALVRPAVSDTFGGVALDLVSTESGLVAGDVYVKLSDTTRAYLAQRIRIVNTHVEGLRSVLGPWSVGPWLGYTGRLAYPDGAPAAGAVVVFRRTAGLRLAADEVTATTDTAGRFDLTPVPLGEGVVVGSLGTRTAGGGVAPLASVELQTFEADERRRVGTWTIPRP